MKLIVTITFFFSLINFQFADYSPISLPKLIEHAELIAHAKIISMNEDYFEAIIIENIKSEINTDTLKVEYFKDWFCASRYKTYQVGQEELVFLRKIKDSTVWNIIGFGNEGEMPIIDNKLYYKSPLHTETPYFKKDKGQSIGSRYFFGSEYSLEEAIEGINKYLEKQEAIKKMFEDETIIDFYPENQFLKRAIDELIVFSYYRRNKDLIEKRQF